VDPRVLWVGLGVLEGTPRCRRGEAPSVEAPHWPSPVAACVLECIRMTHPCVADNRAAVGGRPCRSRSGKAIRQLLNEECIEAVSELARHGGEGASICWVASRSRAPRPMLAGFGCVLVCLCLFVPFGSTPRGTPNTLGCSKVL
jgi:hypothetical protein